VLTQGLENLEYRGYDSVGVAVTDTDVPLQIFKKSAHLEELMQELDGLSLDSPCVGIGHTRWSTHGEPSWANAHPQTDCNDTVAVVHNGIVENYEKIRTRLRKSGHSFSSETDTEVVPHLIEHYRENGLSFKTAFSRAIDEIEGSYAIVAMMDGTKELLAARNDSPLVLGLADGELYIASDVPAFLEFTEQVIFLEDGEMVHATESEFTVFGPDGDERSKTVEAIDWEQDHAQKSEYDHYMLKEIYEHPRAVRGCLSDRFSSEFDDFELSGLSELDDIESVVLIGAGTSYHAAEYGARLFRDRDIPAEACIAGEFNPVSRHLEPNTLVLGLTQSGETADTLQALRRANDAGYETLSVTNVVGSTASRIADHVFYIRSGPEIGVAATKTFSTQLLSLVMIATVYADNLDTTGQAAGPMPEVPPDRSSELAERFIKSDRPAAAVPPEELENAIDHYRQFSTGDELSAADVVTLRVVAGCAAHHQQSELISELGELLRQYVAKADMELVVNHETSESELSPEQVLKVLAERKRRLKTAVRNAFDESIDTSHLAELQRAYLVSNWDLIDAFGDTDQLAAWAGERTHKALIADLRSLDAKIDEFLGSGSIEEIAKSYNDAELLFVLGEGFNYAVAQDAAMKASQVSYKSAHAFHPSEMKHGPLALVTQETPVIGILAGENINNESNIDANLKEVQARGAPLIVIAEENQEIPLGLGQSDAVIRVPEARAELAPILVTTAIQLFIYHLAKSLDRAIDKPRNLAKSVTVE
jgi:glucosamine--fructose-6-phosphate aminotransferase (isomerizing)